MASLQDIRRRIRSVKNTQQVTKAMKMISAVKLRKSQDRLLALRPYATRLAEITSQVIARLQQTGNAAITSPLAQAFIKARPEQRVRLVVIASDKGLCGGFNANVLKAAQAFLQQTASEVVHLDVVGKRAADWARKGRLEVQGDHQGVPLQGLNGVATAVAQDAARQYQEGAIDALYVAYNHFNSPVSQVPKVVRIFPVEVEANPEGRVEVPHLLEPDPQTVLEDLLPRFVELETLHCLLESSASEHGARMASMDKASSNAAEMIDKLTLHMNKVRQAAITNQIIEVVSGASA